jgi:uncharacterized protein
MLGVLNKDQMEALLRKCYVGRIGCCADNKPYIVPISYAYEDGYIYCHTDEGKKARIMRKNPAVCFQVENMKSMANWKSVIIEGEYEELVDKEQRSRGMDILLRRYLPVISSVTVHLGELWPFSPDDTSEIEGIVFRISVNAMSGRFEKSDMSPFMAG